ncbi:MAG: hypothetical protein ACOC5T_05425 [Elusimicrobiota bacterium]
MNNNKTKKRSDDFEKSPIEKRALDHLDALRELLSEIMEQKKHGGKVNPELKRYYEKIAGNAFLFLEPQIKAMSNDQYQDLKKIKDIFLEKKDMYKTVTKKVRPSPTAAPITKEIQVPNLLSYDEMIEIFSSLTEALWWTGLTRAGELTNEIGDNNIQEIDKILEDGQEMEEIIEMKNKLKQKRKQNKEQHNKEQQKQEIKQTEEA